MTIVCDERNQTIALQGSCSVEESEELLQHIDAKGWPIELSGLNHLHTACLQVLLLRKPKLIGQSLSPVINMILSESLGSV